MGSKPKTSKQQSLAGASDQLLNDALSDINGLFGGGDSQADAQAPRESPSVTPEVPAEKTAEAVQAPSSVQEANVQVIKPRPDGQTSDTSAEASAEEKQKTVPSAVQDADAKVEEQVVAEPKPKPKRKRKTVVARGAEGACLIPLPPKRVAKPEREAMLIRLPVEDKKAVEQMAEERGLSVSAFCAAILHAIVQQARNDT